MPCVHRYWVKGAVHFDPGYVLGDPQWDELVTAIRNDKRVILTSDMERPAPEKKSGVAFDRTGYIAVFEVGDVEANDEGLRFVLKKRLKELK
jgi:hypothetical protein